MTPELRPAALITGMHNRARRHMAPVAGVADRATQVVVVGQLVGENGKTADLLQHVAAKRDGGAETGVGHA